MLRMRQVNGAGSVGFLSLLIVAVATTLASTSVATPAPTSASTLESSSSATPASTTASTSESSSAVTPASNRVKPPLPYCHHEHCHSYYNSYEVEGNIIYIFTDLGFIRMGCEGLSVMNSPALPSFNPALVVTTVVLEECPPPATGSLADSLSTLNVTLVTSQSKKPASQTEGLVFRRQPTAPPLAARHFIGLEDLVSLHISGAENKPITLDYSFLTPLRNLAYLTIEEAVLTAEHLNTLPPQLHKLTLLHTSIEQMPKTLLSTTLYELVILSKRAFDGVAVPSGLSELYLDTSATKLKLETTQALRSLVLFNWEDAQPQPLTSCANLTELVISSPTVTALPDNWLAQCLHLDKIRFRDIKSFSSLPPKLLTNTSALRSFGVDYSILETLPAELFHDTPKLISLFLNNNRIQTLPAGLLDYTPELIHLDLSNNHLQMLPSGFFNVPRRLRTLKLASNELNSDAIFEISTLDGIISLKIANNTRIGDVCTESGVKWTTQLKTHETNVMRLCHSFITDMRCSCN